MRYCFRFYYLYKYRKKRSQLRFFPFVFKNRFVVRFYRFFKKKLYTRIRRRKNRKNKEILDSRFCIHHNYFNLLLKQLNFTLFSTVTNVVSSQVFLNIKYFLNNRRPVIKSSSLMSEFISFELKKGVPINEVLSDLTYWFRMDKRLKRKLKYNKRYNLMNYVQLYFNKFASFSYFNYIRFYNLRNYVTKLVDCYKGNKFNSSHPLFFNIYGYRVICSGRPFGQPRTTSYTRWFGKMPLSTLNYNIDYSYNYAITKYGVIGVKVWIFFG